MMLSLFALMLVLFAIGTPVAWAMVSAAIIYMLLGPNVPIHGLVQRMAGGIDTFPLLAIPFFILAGNLMNTGGITDRLVAFAKTLVGHITGGLAHVVVVTNMIMAGMSGSGVADAAGTGAVLIPAMKKAGYPARFAAGIVAAAGTIGPIIPPSIPFVIYGSMANVSVGRLLLAGAIPGVLMGIWLMVFAYIMSKRSHYPSERRATCGEVARATLDALPPMGMPVIILGGIIGGVMTPTEAASAGAAYAFILGFFVYKELKVSDLGKIVVETAIATASIGIIISAAAPFGFVLTLEQSPNKVLALVEASGMGQLEFLIWTNLVLLILGCFMEGTAIMIMAIPVMLPLLMAMNVDLVHFGVVFVINIMIGNITPPVGNIMYVVCAINKLPIWEFAKGVWPFIIALVIALLMVTFIPDLAMTLPNMLMPVK